MKKSPAKTTIYLFILPSKFSWFIFCREGCESNQKGFPQNPSLACSDLVLVLSSSLVVVRHRSSRTTWISPTPPRLPPPR
ncbi:hypothetical protein Pfo_009589 [Paulownia fortunei]|nr:hypothetical protein Pfo_009589 [Paulownia fortunei]